MVEIPLTKGKVALIDAVDLPLVGSRKWHYDGKYAARKNACEGKVYMHRVILSPPAGMDTDHVNGDRLDNRRANLRVATRSLNNANRRERRPGKYSPYRGVTRIGSRNLKRAWVAQLQVNGEHVYLGLFGMPEEAARAYDIAARQAWGAYAVLNFPDGED